MHLKKEKGFCYQVHTEAELNTIVVKQIMEVRNVLWK